MRVIRFRWLLVGLGVLALVAVGCADPAGEEAGPSVGPEKAEGRLLTDEEVARLGECSPLPPGQYVEYSAFTEAMGFLPALWVIDGDTFAGLGPDAGLVESYRSPLGDVETRFRRLSLDELGAEVLFGSAESVAFPESKLGVLRDAAVGRRIVTGVKASGFSAMTAVIDTAGRLAFIGDCLSRLSADFQEIHSVLYPEMEPVELLVALAKDPATQQAANDWLYRPSPSWYELDPSVRLINPDETPPEVMANLMPVSFVVEIPDSWRSLGPYTLCTRILEIGWNECINLQTAALVDELPGTVKSGLDLEVWVLNEAAIVNEPVALVGIIPAAAAELARDAGQVRLILSDTVHSIGDLLAPANLLMRIETSGN